MAIPAVKCPLPGWPQFPKLDARPLSDETGSAAVAISAKASAELWLWVKDVERWRDVAVTCYGQ